MRDRRPLVNRLLCLALLGLMAMPTASQAVIMGGPGMYPAKGDFVASANTGFRNITLLNRSGTASGTFEEMRAFELMGKFGYQAAKWLQPQVQLGATTFNRTGTGFKSFLRPQVGLMFRMPFIQNEKKLSFGLDIGSVYAPLKGTRTGSTREIKSHKLDSVAGLTFAYCLERSCVYVGGRYTYLWVKEGGSTSDRHLGGLYGGVDYFVTPNIFFGLEAQNFDGDAIYGGVGGRF